MTPVVVCIPTTKDRKDRLEKCVNSIHEFAGYPHIIMTYENYREGFIKPIHLLLDTLRPEQLVWCIGDDSVLTEPDTIKRMVDTFNEKFPNRDGVVQPDDGIHAGKIITMPLCTVDTMRKGTHEGYFLNYADLEFTAVISCLGRYAYNGNVKVDHQHWINGKAEKDATYEYAHSMNGADGEFFQQRKAQAFKDNRLLL